MSYLSVRVAHVIVAFVTFVFFVQKGEIAARSTFSIALTDGLLISNSLLMVREIFLAPKMSVAVRTGYSNPCRYIRRTRYAVATYLVANVCHIARTPLQHALHTYRLAMTAVSFPIT